MGDGFLDERSYLPFELSKLPEGPWLILAPHADDESFGMGGTLILAADADVKRYIVFMTDGAKGGDADSRKNEALLAGEMLGVSNVFFLGESDRSLYPNFENTQFVADMIKKFQIKSLFFPHPMEAHPDHRATASIAWEALRQIQFLAAGYSYEVSSQGVVNMLIDITSVMKRKKKLMSIYESQLSQNNYSDVIKAINKTRTWSLAKEVEYAEAFYRWQKTDKNLATALMRETKKIYSYAGIPCLCKRGIDWFKRVFR